MLRACASAVAEQPARNHQVAGEQRRAAFADQALADDERLDAAALQVERRVTAGGAAADDRHIGRQISACRGLC